MENLKNVNELEYQRPDGDSRQTFRNVLQGPITELDTSTFSYTMYNCSVYIALAKEVSDSPGIKLNLLNPVIYKDFIEPIRVTRS
jgi:hypothetical protein